MIQSQQKKFQKSDFDVKWLDHMGIPKVHWYAKITKVPDRCSHKRHVAEYIGKIRQNIVEGKGLYLWGDFGRGKSALAALILIEACRVGYVGYWIRAKEIPRHIIEKTDFDEDLTVIERAETCPILVIDEFQIRFSETKFTEWSAEDLIRIRVDAKLPTIVTSNITPPLLEKGYPALYSVLLEAFLPIKVQGHDFRKEKAGKDGSESI